MGCITSKSADDDAHDSKRNTSKLSDALKGGRIKELGKNKKACSQFVATKYLADDTLPMESLILDTVILQCVHMRSDVTVCKLCGQEGLDFMWALMKSVLYWVQSVVKGELRTNDPCCIKLALILCRVANTLHSLDFHAIQQLNSFHTQTETLRQAFDGASKLLLCEEYNARNSILKILSTVYESPQQWPRRAVSTIGTALTAAASSESRDLSSFSEADSKIRTSMSSLLITLVVAVVEDPEPKPANNDLTAWCHQMVGQKLSTYELRDQYQTLHSTYIKKKGQLLHEVTADICFSMEDAGIGTLLLCARKAVSAKRFEALIQVVGYDGVDMLEALQLAGVSVPLEDIETVTALRTMPWQFQSNAEDYRWSKGPTILGERSSKGGGLKGMFTNKGPACMAIHGLDGPTSVNSDMCCGRPARIDVQLKYLKGNFFFCKDHKDWIAATKGAPSAMGPKTFSAINSLRSQMLRKDVSIPTPTPDPHPLPKKATRSSAPSLAAAGAAGGAGATGLDPPPPRNSPHRGAMGARSRFSSPDASPITLRSSCGSSFNADASRIIASPLGGAPGPSRNSALCSSPVIMSPTATPCKLSNLNPPLGPNGTPFATPFRARTPGTGFPAYQPNGKVPGPMDNVGGVRTPTPEHSPLKSRLTS